MTHLQSMSNIWRLRRGLRLIISIILHAVWRAEREDVDNNALRNHDLSLSTRGAVLAKNSTITLFSPGYVMYDCLAALKALWLSFLPAQN